jgi:hypothetical protein
MVGEYAGTPPAVRHIPDSCPTNAVRDVGAQAKAGFRSPFPDVRRLFSNYPQVASPTSADNPQQSQTSHLFKGRPLDDSISSY